MTNAKRGSKAVSSAQPGRFGEQGEGGALADEVAAVLSEAGAVESEAAAVDTTADTEPSARTGAAGGKPAGTSNR